MIAKGSDRTTVCLQCRTRVELISRLDEEIGGEGEGSPRSVELKAHRSALAAEEEDVGA